MKTKLRYIGSGGFVYGVPAKNIEVDEEKVDELIATGLYEREEEETSPGELEVNKETPPKSKSTHKIKKRGESNG